MQHALKSYKHFCSGRQGNIQGGHKVRPYNMHLQVCVSHELDAVFFAPGGDFGIDGEGNLQSALGGDVAGGQHVFIHVAGVQNHHGALVFLHGLQSGLLEALEGIVVGVAAVHAELHDVLADLGC